MRFLVLLSAAAIPLVTSSCLVPPPTESTSTPSALRNGGAYGATETRIFNLINQQRRARGLAALVFDAQLNRAAEIQAQNMASFEKMAHVLPGAKLPTLADRARYVGYPSGRIAENVALGYPNAETVVEGWMNSRGHRENILNREVMETGIAIMRSRDGGLYYCQVFGRRLSSL